MSDTANFLNWWQGGAVTELVCHLEGEDDAMECYRALSELAWDASNLVVKDELESVKKLLNDKRAYHNERNVQWAARCRELQEQLLLAQIEIERLKIEANS